MIYIHESFLTPLKIIIKYFISAVKIPSFCTSWDLSNDLLFSINNSLELMFQCVWWDTKKLAICKKNEKKQMLTLLVNNFLILEVILNSLCMARDFGV